MKSNTLKNTTDKSKWNSKNDSSNAQEGRKKGNDKEQTEIEIEIGRLESSIISITKLNVSYINLPNKKQIFKLSLKSN